MNRSLLDSSFRVSRATYLDIINNILGAKKEYHKKPEITNIIDFMTGNLDQNQVKDIIPGRFKDRFGIQMFARMVNSEFIEDTINEFVNMM